MAKLITTQAEKDAASFLDWDDAALGKMCKKMAIVLQSKRREQRGRGQNDNGPAFELFMFGFGVIAAMMLYALWKHGII